MSVILSYDTDSTITDAVLDKSVADGVQVIMLYLKHATADLIAKIHARGISVGLIFETTAERALQGAPAGSADAATTLAIVFGDKNHPGLGNPPATVCAWATADFDEQASQDPVCKGYFTAYRDGLHGRLDDGAYGNGALDVELKAAGIVGYAWVAGGSAMRGTKAMLASGEADLVQDVGDKRGLSLGIDIDSDTAKDPALPWAWHPPQGIGVIITPPAPPPLALGSRVLRMGMTGDDVAALQAKLGVSPADGKFGPHTKAAVEAFQQAHALIDDGVAGPATLAALVARTA